METFGNVPYTEALEFDNFLSSNDDGLIVYMDLISRLTVAINGHDVSKGSYDTADRIYQGDVTQWKKFANSLKLRMGNLLSDVEPVFAQSTITEVLTSGVITSADDNATYSYLTADPNTNPVYSNIILSGRLDYVAGKTVIDIMMNLNDSRLPLFFTKINGNY